MNITTLLLLCAASLAILLPSPTSAQCNNHLLSGETLRSGDFLTSGHVYLAMQKDCNLVLYDSGRAIWASGTSGHGSDCFASMQSDGNFVVYDSGNAALWSSKTYRENGYYVLLLQKDRNLVIYGSPLWATGTNYVGSVSVVVAAARNGTVGISGAEQNKVREMGKIVEIVSGY